MPLSARRSFDFSAELMLSPGSGEPPLLRESIDEDLTDLVHEAVVSAFLADELHAGVGDLDVVVSPVWEREPVAREIEVRIERPGGAVLARRRFGAGRWTRRAHEVALHLATDGDLGADARIYVCLVAESRRSEIVVPLRAQLPRVLDGSLDALGVRGIGVEPLCPDRPVLANRRMVERILDETVQSGPAETGGSMLGGHVRLDEPLVGTTTRVVTVLTHVIPDARHVGAVGRVTFDTGALADAAQIAVARGRGERVLTAYHSHGWGSECGRCNANPDCAIPSASFVSTDDYRVLESLFPSKSTVMPIAGRKLGASGDRPILEIHRWALGRMEPIPWRTYDD